MVKHFFSIWGYGDKRVYITPLYGKSAYCLVKRTSSPHGVSYAFFIALCVLVGKARPTEFVFPQWLFARAHLVVVLARTGCRTVGGQHPSREDQQQRGERGQGERAGHTLER